MTPIAGVTQKKLLRMSACMDRSCCSTSGFSLYLDDSPTTRFTGSGTFYDPIKSNVKISAEIGNTLLVKPDGLYVPPGNAGLTQVITEASDTISFTGLGTQSNPLIANYIGPLGITEVVTEDTVNISLEGSGTVSDPLKASIIGTLPAAALQAVTDIGNNTTNDIFISSNVGTLSQFSVYNAASNSIAALQTYVDDIHGDLGTSTLFLQGYQKNSIMFASNNPLQFERDDTTTVATLQTDGRFTGTSAINAKDFVTLDQLPAASAPYTFSDTGFTI